MVRAGMTSGTIMAGGDLLCQTIDQRNATPSRSATLAAKPSTSQRDDDDKSEGESESIAGAAPATAGYDLMRTARFAAVGLTLHGPFFNK
jgi:protein Mpv17